MSVGKKINALDEATVGTLNRRIPGQMNALFKLISKDGMIHQRAHMHMLPCMGIKAAHGVEGMFHVELHSNAEGVIVRIS